jgi:hypothetical protein
MKLYGWAALAVVVVFGIGWITGASGKSDLELARRAAAERADEAEVRGLVLDGRVQLYTMNYGEATRRFADARTILERVQTELREQGLGERAGRLEVALGHLREAQRLALALDPSAHNQAAEALRALGR